MPTYRDLYDIVTEALEKIAQIVEEAKTECEELYDWGIKGAEGGPDIPPQYLSEELDNTNIPL